MGIERALTSIVADNQKINAVNDKNKDCMIRQSPDDLSVLIVEDDPVDAKITRAALMVPSSRVELTHRVSIAQSLGEAIDYLATNVVDVVLLDLGLPDSIGVEAISEVAAASPNSAIVVVSGREDEDIAIDALHHGASEYVMKSDMQGPMLRRVIRYAVERRNIEAEIAALARSDTLTGLMNRGTFFNMLEAALAQAKRNGTICAVMHLDLDHFKDINDTLGHAAGDALLLEVAERLRDCTRQIDLVARLGGDEFAVAATNLQNIDGAAEVAQKILNAFDTIDMIDGHQVKVHTSIGITVFPDDNVDAHELVAHADLALYQAKSEGRGKFQFFDKEMDRIAQARRTLKNDMLEALENGEFVVHFQPILDSNCSDIVAVEALARWDHKSRGFVSPDEFIPLAEETGLIVELGAHLLKQACLQQRRWLEQGHSAVPMAVNVSSLQFKRHDFSDRVISIVADAAIPASSIQLEITESVLMTDLASVTAHLHKLRDYGIKIAIDDFGTGYSSLAYLKTLPVDKLKIDRSFINELENDIGAQCFVNAIAGLARSVNKEIVAEGVETSKQLGILRDLGINQLQGFLFSKPVDDNGFIQWRENLVTQNYDRQMRIA